MRRTLAVLALAAAASIVSSCAPVPLLQDARIVRQGKTRVGIGGAAFVPVDPGTYWQPDGPTMAEDYDLQYHPLLHVIGWARYGLGGQTEIQTAFQLPSFTISVGAKIGIVGPRWDSDFALAVSGDVSVSPVLVDFGYGGSLHMSARLAEEVSLDLSGRVGTFPGLWHSLQVTPTLGVTLGGETDQIHIAVGAVIPVLGDDSAFGGWVGAGTSY